MKLSVCIGVMAVCIALITPSIAYSESADRDISITAYNNGFALVKDSRTMTLKTGINNVDLQDVAALIDPTSVLFKSISYPNAVSVLEQNFQYDLISPESILRKSTGIKLTFTRFDKDGKPHTDSGVLVSDGNSMVVKGADGLITLNPQGQISLEKMPAGLRSKPTLNWLLKSDKAGTHKTQISYITNGISWKADYVALVNKEDNSLDMSGWVSLTNGSGMSYKNAKLALIAGDVRRVQPARPVVYAKAATRAAKPAPQFEEKSFFEYHMYSMGRRTTVADNETKQLSLLNVSGAKVVKEMIFDGRGSWFSNWYYPGRVGAPGDSYDTREGKLNVILTVKNSKTNKMGMPLPKGTVRVYKEDDTGSRQFIGEDSIDHTPKDETLRLHIGDAFDVLGVYKRTNFSKISDRVVEESFEVTIKNHKDTPVDVKVVDHVWSDWKVISSSDKYTKKDATTIEFPVSVPANKNKVVKYTIRVKW